MSGERVLVVDDEPQIRRAVGAALAWRDYQVESAESAESALIVLATRPIDAVVLDLMMPGMDGFDMLREVRGWSEVPIVVLSARGQERDKVAALDLGADDYLTKPFGIDELVARLRAVLRRIAPRGEPILRFDDVTIDLEARAVTRHGEPLHLTPTEYDLLCLLARNAGKVLTHQQLLTRVWGPHAAKNSPQLRVYVNYLRRKLEDDPARPRLLLTEPGVGYRWRNSV